MLEQKIKIDQKEYIIRSTDWKSDILSEAAIQLEEGIQYYKRSKDEISAVVLAALAFAYDSVAKSKNGGSIQKENSAECKEDLQKILQKITKHIQTPQKTI
jgi:cell division protein ZapA (FtsZ GTPase activity inhibitor)